MFLFNVASLILDSFYCNLLWLFQKIDEKVIAKIVQELDSRQHIKSSINAKVVSLISKTEEL